MSKHYRVAVDGVILAVSTVSVLADKPLYSNSDAFDVVLALMVVDTLLKFAVVGPRRLWSFSMHRYDTIMTMAALLCLMILASSTPAAGSAMQR